MGAGKALLSATLAKKFSWQFIDANPSVKNIKNYIVSRLFNSYYLNSITIHIIQQETILIINGYKKTGE